MTNKVVATAGLVTVGVGSVNAIANHKTLPSTKFLLGSGVAFLILSIMADTGLEDVAQPLALAVMTTVILGEGNGVLSWINGKGEVDTQRPKAANVTRAEHGKNTTSGNPVSDVAEIRFVTPADYLTPFPGLAASN